MKSEYKGRNGQRSQFTSENGQQPKVLTSMRGDKKRPQFMSDDEARDRGAEESDGVIPDDDDWPMEKIEQVSRFFTSPVKDMSSDRSQSQKVKAPKAASKKK